MDVARQGILREQLIMSPDIIKTVPEDYKNRTEIIIGHRKEDNNVPNESGAACNSSDLLKTIVNRNLSIVQQPHQASNINYDSNAQTQFISANKYSMKHEKCSEAIQSPPEELIRRQEFKNDHSCKEFSPHLNDELPDQIINDPNNLLHRNETPTHREVADQVVFSRHQGLKSPHGLSSQQDYRAANYVRSQTTTQVSKDRESFL